MANFHYSLYCFVANGYVLNAIVDKKSFRVDSCWLVAHHTKYTTLLEYSWILFVVVTILYRQFRIASVPKLFSCKP
jgi:hypothetical protein